MSVDVIREEKYGIDHHLLISAAGVPLHLTATLETKDLILLKVEPDEPQWRVLAMSNVDDPDGLVLALERY